MPAYEQKHKEHTRDTVQEIEHHEVSEETKQRLADNSDKIDDLLEEIDNVLEENAQEFVQGFVQKGGE